MERSRDRVIEGSREQVSKSTTERLNEGTRITYYEGTKKLGEETKRGEHGTREKGNEEL